MMAVVRDIPRKRFEYLQTLGKTDWQVFWEIVVIETIPHAFENMRQNNAITFTLLPLVEVISRTGGGLGMMMWDSKKYGGPVATFAMELVLLLIGVCLDHLIKKGRLAACPHLEKKKGH